VIEFTPPAAAGGFAAIPGIVRTVTSSEGRRNRTARIVN
jgi:hypothetical protein